MHTYTYIHTYIHTYIFIHTLVLRVHTSRPAAHHFARRRGEVQLVLQEGEHLVPLLVQLVPRLPPL